MTPTTDLHNPPPPFKTHHHPTPTTSIHPPPTPYPPLFTWAYGKEWPWTPYSFTRARHAQPFYHTAHEKSTTFTVMLLAIKLIKNKIFKGFLKKKFHAESDAVFENLPQFSVQIVKFSSRMQNMYLVSFKSYPKVVNDVG
jgi:hypothetical protein